MSPRTRAAYALRQHTGIVAVAAAVLLGIAMRVAGWTWGFPADLHPDEWVIVNGALDLVHRKSFEPSMYYRPDHVEIQLSYLAYTFYSHVFLHLPVEGAYARHPDHFLLISRAITTMFGVAMIVLAYLIGKRFDRTVGLLAAALFALFPPFVENSQYATPDVPLTACLMVVVLGCMYYLAAPGRASLLVACAATSTAIAIKYPGALGTVTIAVVIVYAGIRDRRFVRIAGHGALALVAVIGFLFAISPVLFTNAHAVIDSLKGESGSNHGGVEILGWDGNVGFYAHNYLLWAGTILAVLSVVGLVVVIRLKCEQAIPLVLSVVYWLALSAVALHWPRWGLPMFVTPLLLAALAAVLGFRWLRERSTLGSWLVPVAVVLGVVCVGNMVVNDVPAATRPFATDSRLAMQPELERLGVTTKTAVYEGYSPLLPGRPKEIFDEFTEVDGRLVPVDARRRFVVLSACMEVRYHDDPKATSQRAFLRKLAQQAPLVAKIRADVVGWDNSWFEPLNIVRASDHVRDYLSGGHTGCDIDVRRLQ
jgi:hypothetical protein